MISPFDKSETWVETGPDGLHYYVRKKEPPKLPSFKAIFREAIHDLWHGPSPYWKELKRASKNRRLTAPATTPASQVFSNHFPHSISRISLQPPAMQSSEESSNNIQPRGILKPEPQRFPSGPNGGPPLAGWPLISHAPAHSFPAMGPNIQQSYAGYPPQVGYNVMQVHNPMQTHLSNLNLPPGQPQTHYPHLNFPPGPTQPPGGFQGPALPPGARAISPPRYPSQDDLKYKCAICGRFRSARYNYTHRLAPGQLPGTTICRRCRNTATDSEDESIDSEASLGRRGRGRRSRALSSRPRSRRSPIRRGRSRSQAAWSDDENDYDDERSRRRRRSISVSRSFDDVRPVRSGSVIMPRRRSPSVEEVEYVRHPRSQKVRRVVYVEDEEPEYLSSYDAGDVEVRTVRRAPRAPTPSHHRIRRQYSDPGLGSTYPSDRVEDFEERGPRSTTVTPWPPPSFSRQGAYQTDSSGVEHDWYGPDPYHRPGRSESRRRGGYEYRRDGHVRPGSSGHPIPAPYPDAEEDQRAVIYKGEDARSTTSSRSMGRASPEFGHRPHLRQVDQQSNSDDYDWYDKDGMCVRVREI